jgi:hypothetical protein
MPDLSGSTNGSGIDFAINDNAPADACAESNIDEIIDTFGGTKIKFPEGSGVGIIDEKGFLAQPFLHYVSQQNIPQPWQVRRAKQNACFRIRDASSSNSYGTNLRNGHPCLLQGMLRRVQNGLDYFLTLLCGRRYTLIARKHPTLGVNYRRQYFAAPKVNAHSQTSYILRHFCSSITTEDPLSTGSSPCQKTLFAAMPYCILTSTNIPR